MKKFNNKSGFTLIEIIVVLIIVGILAAIALPNLFQNVEKSRSAEALSALGTYKSDVEGCVQAHDGPAMTSFCSTLSAVGIPSPNTTNFTMTMPSMAGTSSTDITYTLSAQYNANAGDTIVMTRNTDGSITCAGTSAFAGAC